MYRWRWTKLSVLRSVFWCVAYKKLLGQTEIWTCEWNEWQSIRTVWDISRDDRARIATGSLLTPTDRLKDNYSILAGVPVGGKSSVCLICMKYRIIILIIIIKRPGEILLSYIANTSRTHSRTHPVLMYPSHSQHFIIDEIHLLSLTIFAQEALVTRNV